MHDSVKLIQNAFVYTADKNNRCGLLPILIRGDKILEVGKRAEALSSQFPYIEIIDARGKVIFPGFIDCFYHSESALLRYFVSSPYPNHKSLADFLSKAIQYFTSSATVDELKSLYRLAYFSALKAGVTTLVDFGLDYLDISFRASLDVLQQSDLRAFIGLLNGDQYENSLNSHNNRVKYFIVLPDTRVLTLYNLHLSQRLAQQRQLPILIVDCENQNNNEAFKKKFGKTLLQLCNEHHLFDTHMLVVNPGGYDERDYDILKQKKITVIITPRHCIYSDNECLPVAELINRNIPVALATGWGMPDPFCTMKSFENILALHNAATLSPFDIISAQTLYAAQLLALKNELGSIEQGKNADLVFINCNNFFTKPFIMQQHPELLLQLLLTETTARDVSDVMIGGEFCVREGTLLIYSEEEIIRDASALLQKISTQLEYPKYQQHIEAAVFPLETNKTSVDNDIPMEEGYRIIRRNRNESENTTKDGMIPKQELPKNVRRVFGDENENENN